MRIAYKPEPGLSTFSYVEADAEVTFANPHEFIFASCPLRQYEPLPWPCRRASVPRALSPRPSSAMRTMMQTLFRRVRGQPWRN